MIIQNLGTLSRAYNTPEAIAAVALMPEPLAAGEADKILLIVDTMVASGTWAKLDFFFLHCLTNDDNSLTSLIGTKLAVADVSLTHDTTGWEGDGTGSIDYNITASSDLTLATQNDIYMEAYLHTAGSNLGALFGYAAGGSNSDMYMYDFGTDIAWQLNVSSSETYLTSKFTSKTRWGIGRSSASSSNLYKDNVSVDSDSSTSKAMNSGTILAFSTDPNDNFRSDHKISYFFIGENFAGAELTALASDLELVQSEFSLN